MFEAFFALQRETLNGPSFNPVPALVAKLLKVWVRTSGTWTYYSVI